MPTLDWLTRREDEQTAGKALYLCWNPFPNFRPATPRPRTDLVCGTLQDAIVAHA
jgi:hypothetical protein